MTDLVRFLIRHAALGFAIGVVFTAALLVLDIGQLRTLTEGSRAGLAARLLLLFFVSSTFASLQMGVAIMLSGKDDGSDDAER